MHYLGSVKPLPPVTEATDGDIYIATDPQNGSVRMGIAPVKPGGTVSFPEMIGTADLIPCFQTTSPFESGTGTVADGRRSFQIAANAAEGDYYFGTDAQSHPYRIAVSNQGRDSAAFVLNASEILEGRLSLAYSSTEKPLVCLGVNGEGLTEDLVLTVTQKVVLPVGQSSGLLSLANMPAGASITVSIDGHAYNPEEGSNIEVLGGEELEIEIEPPPSDG